MYYRNCVTWLWRLRRPMITLCKLENQESWWYNLVWVWRPKKLGSWWHKSESKVQEPGVPMSESMRRWHSNSSWSQQLVKLAIILSLLHHPNRKIEWGCVTITSLASFKSSIVALISVILPRMQYCFQFTIFLGRGCSDDFHSAFSIIVALLYNSGNQVGDSSSTKSPIIN